MQAESLIPIVANIGLLAILAWIVSFFGSALFDNLDEPDTKSQLVIGLTFGIGASLLMEMPIELQQGIIGDGRGGPILLAGMIGGPVAAVITGTIAAAVRVFIGGAGATSGVAYIICFAAIGCLWRLVCEKKGFSSVHWTWLVAVSTFATVISIPTIFLMPEAARWDVLTIIWPQVWVENVVGCIILGSLINRERIRVEMEAELVEKEKRAIAGTEAKSRFLAAMSHEIRTPINAILGILQLLQNKLTSRDDKQDIKAALGAGDALLSLIGQVLDFAKIEAGVISVQKEIVCINTLFNDLSSMFSNIATDRGITIQFHDNLSGRTIVSADQAKIRQVLFNLIGNALKFTEQGRVDVSVRSRAQEMGELYLEFEVQDTGPGVDPADHDVIFEEFGQSDAGRMSSSGSGLGLSISRHLALAMGGDISVQSALGRGARFAFSLNVKPAAVTELPIEYSYSDQSRTSGTARILLVEDNDINRSLATRMLEADGHDVIGVEDGQHAVDLIVGERQKFDIVFMDIQMPRMTGDEATRVIIENIDEAERPPIVALTANALAEQMEEYRNVGMTAVLTKPMRIKELRRMIQVHSGVSVCESSDQVAKSASPPEVIDFKALQETLTVMNLGDELTTLSKIHDRSKELLERMKVTPNAHDNVAANAHNLAGMLGNFGLESASDSVRLISIAAKRRRDTRPEVSDAITQVEQSFELAYNHYR